MKARILQSCAGNGFAYKKGEVLECTPEIMANFVHYGLAEVIIEKAVKPITRKVPNVEITAKRKTTRKRKPSK